MDFGVRFNTRAQIQRSYVPCVMVAATTAAEEAARKNDLTLVDLFLPFSTVNTSNVTFQSQGDGTRPYKLPEFRVNLCYMSDIGQPPEQFVDAQCTRVVEQYSRVAEESIASITCRSDVANYLTTADGMPKDVVPWFTRWKKEFAKGMRCSNFEYFDHPVACILVASSQDDDPIGKLRGLYDMPRLPPIFREGSVDPNVFKHYVLIHDEQSADPRKTDEICWKMQETFGPSASTLLRVNSLPVDQPNNEQNDIWAQYREFGEARGRRGRYLAVQDIASLQKFISDFVVMQLIPQIDRRMKSLNQNVTATRKGFKNQLKSWWGKPKGGETREGFLEAADGGCPQYLYNSIEAQIRQLADLEFMMQDYELALQNYRLVQADYKKDRAWYQFAAASEMIAVCTFMLDGSKRETESALDTAFTHYQKCGMSRHTVRVTLLQMDIHKARGKMKEAAEALLRCGSSETEDLRAALLLQQAALCFLQMTPNAHFRKYAFHLVLAGHRFYKCSQRAHALQCYMSALHTYQGRCWTFIDDHIHSTLAKHSVALGRVDDAVAFSLKLLSNTSNKPPERQAAYLHEFISIIRKHFADKKRWVCEQPAPHIEDGTVRVVTNDRSHPPEKDEGEEIWEELEEILVDESGYRERRQLERTNQFQNFRRNVDSSIDRNEHVGVVGEPIAVEFAITNPLLVPLDISEMGLVCEYRDGNTQPLVDEAAADLPPAIDIETQALQLTPGQTITLKLSVTPKREGALRIVGVAWKLEGTVLSRHDFAIRGKRLNESLDERTSVRYESDKRLELRIVSPMPLLSLSLHHFPATMLSGEIARAVMEVRNVGRRGAKNLRLQVSRPQSFVIGKQEDIDKPWPADLPQCGADGTIPPSLLSRTDRDGIYTIPLPLPPLLPDHTALVPLWVRTDVVGVHNFKFSLCYEPETDENNNSNNNNNNNNGDDNNNVAASEEDKKNQQSLLKYRLLRYGMKLVVHPSLSPVLSLRPSRVNVNEFVLGVTVESLRQNGVVQLRQLTCLSNFWSLRPLSQSAGVDACSGSVLIHPRTRSTVFFKLSPPVEGAPVDNSGVREVVRTHVAFDPNSKSVDVLQSPHLDLFALSDALSGAAFRKINSLAAHDEHNTSPAPTSSGAPPADFILLFNCFSDKEDRQPLLCQLHFNARAALGHPLLGARRRQSLTGATTSSLSPSPAAAPPTHSRRRSIVGREMSLSPLKFKLNSPSSIDADFANGKLPTVEGTLEVWNSDASTTIDFLFEAINTIEQSEENAISPMFEYHWIGCSLTKSQKLAPGCCVTLPFKVIVPRPGVYNLNRFFLNVSNPGFTSVDAALSDLQHLVVVKDSSSSSSSAQ